MSLVTAPPASANNLQLIFGTFVAINLCNSTLLYVHVLSVRPASQLRRQLAHEGLLLVVLVKARSGWFWSEAKTLDESFDFPDGKHLFVVSFLTLGYSRLLKFPPLCRDNLQGHIFLKGINHYCLCFSFLCLSFSKRCINRMMKQIFQML